MKIKKCLKRLLKKRLRQKMFKNFVENRSDRNKRNIIVFCVITIVVMIVMNFCTALSPLFENRVDVEGLEQIEIPTQKEIIVLVE